MGLSFPIGGAPAINMVNPWAQIAQAAAAYGPAHQQYLQTQAETQDLQMSVGLKKLSFLQQTLPSLPASADHDPRLISAFRDVYNTFGENVPLRADGSLNREALGVHAPWQALLSSDPAAYTYAMALDNGKQGTLGGSRDNWFLAHNVDPTTVPDAIRYAPPHQITTPSEGARILGMVQKEVDDLGKGLGTIGNVRALIAAFAEPVDLVTAPGTMEALAAEVSSNIGPWVKARISQADALGQLDHARLPEIQARIRDLDATSDLREKQAKAEAIVAEYAPELEQSKIVANYARADSAHAALIRANSYADQVQSNLDTAARLTPGSKAWKAALVSIDAELSQLRKQHDAAQKQVDALSTVVNPTAAENAQYQQNRQDVIDFKARIAALDAQADSIRAGTGILSTTTLPDIHAFSRQNPPEDGRQATYKGHTYTYDAATQQWQP